MRSRLTNSFMLVATTVAVLTLMPGINAEPGVTVGVSDIDSLLSQAATLVERLELPMPEPALVGMLGNAMMAPGLVGIDRSKSLQLRIIFPQVDADPQPPSPEDLKPSIVRVLPLAGDGKLYFAALEQAFSAPVQRGQLRHFAGTTTPGAGGVYAGAARGYAILGAESAAVDEATTQVNKNGIDSSSFLKLPGTLRVGLNPQALIRFIEPSVQMTLQAMEQQTMPQNMPMDPAMMLRAEVDTLLDLLRQLDGIAVSVKIGKNTMDFYSRIDPVPDSATAQVIQSLKTPSAKYASLVPADAFLAVSGSGMNVFDTIAEPYGKLVEKIYGAMGPRVSGLGPLMKKTMTDCVGLYSGDYAIGITAEQDGTIGLVEAVALADAAKAKALMDEMMATYNDTWSEVMPGLILQQGATRTHKQIEIQSFSYKTDATAAQKSPAPIPMPPWLVKMTWEIAYVGDSLLFTMGSPDLMNRSIDRLKTPQTAMQQTPEFTRLISTLKHEPVQTYTMSPARLVRALLALSPAITDEMLAAIPGGTGNVAGAAGFAMVKGDNYVDFDRIRIDEIVAIKNLGPMMTQAFMQFVMSQGAAMGGIPTQPPAPPLP